MIVVDSSNIQQRNKIFNVGLLKYASDIRGRRTSNIRHTNSISEGGVIPPMDMSVEWFVGYPTNMYVEYLTSK